MLGIEYFFKYRTLFAVVVLDATTVYMHVHARALSHIDFSLLSGKKVCWLYRKGQCRKGHRCKFAHDNDIFTDAPNTVNTAQSDKQYHLGHGYFNNQRLARDPVDEDSYMANTKRKQRPGVMDHLQPPKKARHMLDKQRAQERPWTVKK